LCALQGLDARLKFVAFPVLAFLLYGSQARVYQLIGHGRASRLQAAGEDPLREVLQLRFDGQELPAWPALAGLGSRTLALLGVVGVMPPTVPLRWLNASRTLGPVPLGSGANWH
jgi:hypothetical protein